MNYSSIVLKTKVLFDFSKQYVANNPNDRNIEIFGKLILEGYTYDAIMHEYNLSYTRVVGITNRVAFKVIYLYASTSNKDALSRLDLSPRLFNCLMREGFATIPLLINYLDTHNGDLRGIRNLGDKFNEEVHEKISSYVDVSKYNISYPECRYVLYDTVIDKYKLSGKCWGILNDAHLFTSKENAENARLKCNNSNVVIRKCKIVLI